MANPFDDAASEYKVLVNDEGQYSLWPVFRQLPDGWAAVGPTGERQLCLDWIEAHWTDMRPKSIRDGAVDPDR
jgi:MbtH protein